MKHEIEFDMFEIFHVFINAPSINTIIALSIILAFILLLFKLPSWRRKK